MKRIVLITIGLVIETLLIGLIIDNFRQGASVGVIPLLLCCLLAALGIVFSYRLRPSGGPERRNLLAPLATAVRSYSAAAEEGEDVHASGRMKGRIRAASSALMCVAGTLALALGGILGIGGPRAFAFVWGAIFLLVGIAGLIAALLQLRGTD